MLCSVPECEAEVGEKPGSSGELALNPQLVLLSAGEVEECCNCKCCHLPTCKYVRTKEAVASEDVFPQQPGLPPKVSMVLHVLLA